MINFKYFTLALAMLAGMGISQALAADPATPATPAANTNQAGGTSLLLGVQQI